MMTSTSIAHSKVSVSRTVRHRLKRFTAVVLFIAALLAIAYLAATLSARPASAHPWFAPRPGDHQPLVFAHQGGEGLRPNNTMEAFRHAVELGADVLDTDMHLTKDGVLVLIHDETVEGTTDGQGAIRDLTLAELKRLDAGYHFTTNGNLSFPYRGRGLTIPTLEELFQAFPDKRFSIEIKPSNPVKTATRFSALLRQYHLQQSVLVSSFRQANMDAFRQACPEAATSATPNEVLWFYMLSQLGLTRSLTPKYHSLEVPEYKGPIHILTPRFIQAARGRGLGVEPWTINEIHDLQRVLNLGVDGINTDFPDRLLELINYPMTAKR